MALPASWRRMPAMASSGSSASSCWLPKDWAPAATVPAARSGVGKAVMLLSASMVNVVIFNLLLRSITAVRTSITPVADRCKRILHEPGDQEAMVCSAIWQELASNGTVWDKIRAQAGGSHSGLADPEER